MPEYTKNIQAQNEQQKNWFRVINQFDVHILKGPAGTGKSYIATAEGCSRLDKGTIGKVVFLRPHVTTEDFGFLPGDLAEKMDPFMQPLVDVAMQRLSAKRYKEYLASGQIEIAALAYLRGRTFHNSWMIFDEAQNSTIAQMKMVLTRIGDNSKLIIAGDITQSDISDKENGLTWILDKLKDCNIVNIVRFSNEDVVRSDTVKILLKHLGE
jgi:phosphate starvation-inducible protein PhoH and related proteins